MAWSDARDYCHLKGGHLIAPETIEAHNYTLSFLDGTQRCNTLTKLYILNYLSILIEKRFTLDSNTVNAHDVITIAREYRNKNDPNDITQIGF